MRLKLPILEDPGFLKSDSGKRIRGLKCTPGVPFNLSIRADEMFEGLPSADTFDTRVMDCILKKKANGYWLTIKLII